MSKKIIYGDTVGTPMPRSDWAEKNERSAAYIKNKPKMLEKLSEMNGCLPAVVDEYDKMLELDDDIVLCYITENRKRRQPITLEVGVTYEQIYIDPRMPNFFPCEPFTVTVETRYGYRSEFITDGLTYFMEKEYDDSGEFRRAMLFNNTNNNIIVDGKVYPPAYKTDVADFAAWSAWQVGSTIMGDDGEPIPYEQPVSLERMHDHDWFSYKKLKFITDEYLAHLENIFSAEDTYEVVRGFYQRMWDGWHRLNDRGFEDIQIGLQSVTEKAHTHDVSDDDNGNVTINLASGNSSGGGIIIGPNGGLEIQSIDITPTEPMKTLTIDNSTYEIVDSEARERLTTIENQGGGGANLPVAYINDDGELIFEIGGDVTDAWINDRGELEVELS